MLRIRKELFTPAPVYTYSFFPYSLPDRVDKHLQQLMTPGRVEIAFTVSGFTEFRTGLLENSGIELREIERVPYADPETVP